MQRHAGILLPITSLPSKYGIGSFSQSAYDFVDWLHDADPAHLPHQLRRFPLPELLYLRRQPLLHQP